MQGGGNEAGGKRAGGNAGKGKERKGDGRKGNERTGGEGRRFPRLRREMPFNRENAVPFVCMFSISVLVLIIKHNTNRKTSFSFYKDFIAAGVRWIIIVILECMRRCSGELFYLNLLYLTPFSPFTFLWCIFWVRVLRILHRKTWTSLWMVMGANGKAHRRGSKWITPLGNNPKEEGAPDDVRDRSGIAERVAGEVGFLQPRTVGEGATSTVALYYIPSATSTLNASEQGISAYNSVFISRSNEARELSPTAFQYKIVPLGLTTNMIAHTPPPTASIGGWLSPIFWGGPRLRCPLACGFIIALIRSSSPLGTIFLQCSLLKLAWG